LLVIVRSGGLSGGGINFDAKTRRNSTDLEDLFFSHIGGIDLFARSLLIVESIINESEYIKLLDERYSSFDTGIGKKFTNRELSLDDIANHAKSINEPNLISGKQEFLENLINRYIR